MPPYRPKTIYRKTRKGEVRLTSDYYVYLRNLVGMSPDERRDWQSLGVRITDARKRRIEDLPDTYDFMVRGVEL